MAGTNEKLPKFVWVASAIFNKRVILQTAMTGFVSEETVCHLFCPTHSLFRKIRSTFFNEVAKILNLFALNVLFSKSSVSLARISM